MASDWLVFLIDYQFYLEFRNGITLAGRSTQELLFSENYCMRDL